MVLRIWISELLSLKSCQKWGRKKTLCISIIHNESDMRKIVPLKINIGIFKYHLFLRYAENWCRRDNCGGLRYQILLFGMFLGKNYLFNWIFYSLCYFHIFEKLLLFACIFDLISIFTHKKVQVTFSIFRYLIDITASWNECF